MGQLLQHQLLRERARRAKALGERAQLRVPRELGGGRGRQGENDLLGLGQLGELLAQVELDAGVPLDLSGAGL